MAGGSGNCVCVCVCMLALCNNVCSLAGCQHGCRSSVYSLFWHLSLDAPLSGYVFLFTNIRTSTPGHRAAAFSFPLFRLPTCQLRISLRSRFSRSSPCLVGAYQHCSHFLALAVQSRYLHFKWGIYFSDMQINGCELCIYSRLLTQQQDQPKQTHWNAEKGRGGCFWTRLMENVAMLRVTGSVGLMSVPLLLA